jgi:Tfp pilus assembly protein PilX
MLLMSVTLHQLVSGRQRAMNNYADHELAQNYAKLALLDAEQTVYNFDLGAGLETNESASAHYRRLLNNATYNIITNGSVCNINGTTIKGWCYSAIPNDPLSNSNPAWRPWESAENAGTSLLPCGSYTPSKTGSVNNVPLIDEKSTFVAAHVFDSGDTSLCSQPRYIMEPLNFAFAGNIRKGQSVESNLGNVFQNNGESFLMYRRNESAITVSYARLYRITVRAFGRNGDTRVTLQEVVAIANNSVSRYSKDSAANCTISNNCPAHDIIPLSVRWISN